MRNRVSAVVLLVLSSVFLAFGQAPSNHQFVVPGQLTIHSGSYPSSAFSGVLGVADFNKDGRKDLLAYYNFNWSDLSQTQYAVLFANGDGSYTAKPTGVSADVYGSGQGVQVADVDGDGRADLVIVTDPPAGDYSNGCDPNYACGNAYLLVYLGNGDGTFHALDPVIIAVDQYASPGMLVDVTKDNRPDLFLTTTTDGCCTELTTVWTNQGGGKFTPQPNLGHYSPIVARDFNGDGYTDLVIRTANGMQIVLNQGGTSFQPGATYPYFPGGVGVGDLNRDRKLDLVETDYSDGKGHLANTGHVLLGNGDGTFRTASTFAWAPTPVVVDGTPLMYAPDVSIADVNRDGEADAVLFGCDATCYAQVWEGNGNGTLRSPIVYNLGNDNPMLLDTNGDGSIDMLLTGSGYRVALNDGKGNFDAPRQSQAFVPDAIVSARLSKSGYPDIVTVSNAPNPVDTPAGNGSVVVYPETGKGYFGPAKSYLIGMPSGVVATGDVNGDGKQDVVVARAALLRTGNGNPAHNLSVLLGKGDGTLEAAKNFATLGSPSTTDKDSFVALADENRDGKLDLVGDWGVALGRGDGTFEAPIPLPAPANRHISQIAAADFNHDGLMDLAVGVSNPDATGRVYVLLANGNGHFTIKEQVEAASVSQVNLLSAADVSGDGKADLISSVATVSAGYNVELEIRLGKGDGTFAAPFTYGTTFVSPSDKIRIGDFNRDGKVDLLLTVPDSQGIAPAGQTAGGPTTLWYGIGGGKLSATPEYYPVTMQSAIVVDLNGDGAPDVAGTVPTGIVRLLNTGSKTPVTK